MNLKMLVLGCVTAAAFGLPAYAADPMAGYYGNTLVVTTPKGERKVSYKADHTYASVDGEGKTSTGTWEVKGSDLCMTRLQPPPDKDRAGAHCRPLAADKKAGDSWENTNDEGRKMSFKLIAGQ